MNTKGQIVEIPAQSEIYRKADFSGSSKKEILEQKVQQRMYSLFDGFLVGEHLGVQHFKLGQRKGINVGGKKKPLYVIGIDVPQNRIFVGEGENHPGLFTTVFSFKYKNVIWRQEFSSKSLNDGISAQISAPQFENTDVHMYAFDSKVYLEFITPVSIVLNESEIALFHHQKLIANLKTTL